MKRELKKNISPRGSQHPLEYPCVCMSRRLLLKDDDYANNELIATELVRVVLLLVGDTEGTDSNFIMMGGGKRIEEKEGSF